MHLSLARVHWIVGAVACVALPALSYVEGSGGLAYTMFAEMRWYELEIRATLYDGTVHEVAPAQLGNQTGGAAALFFSGVDHFRRSPSTRAPRAHLRDIAELACSISGAASIDVTLHERATLDEPDRATTARVTCER